MQSRPRDKFLDNDEDLALSSKGVRREFRIASFARRLSRGINRGEQ
jgi:hypothetical protein